MELPEILTGLRVVGQDVAGHVLDARLVVTLFRRVADDQHVVDDDRRRRGGDVAKRQGQALRCVIGQLGVLPGIPIRDQVLQHVDRAGLRKAADGHGAAKALERLARLGVERVQEEARGRDIDHALAVDAAVGHALAVVRAHRIRVTRCLGFLECPQRLAGGRVERHHRAARARCRQQHAVDVDRQRAAVDVADVDAGGIGRAPFPRHLQRIEVRGIDLVERGVARRAVASRDVRPIRLVLGLTREARKGHRDYDREPANPRVTRPVSKNPRFHRHLC